LLLQAVAAVVETTPVLVAVLVDLELLQDLQLVLALQSLLLLVEVGAAQM
jgi:hypothetical protein